MKANRQLAIAILIGSLAILPSGAASADNEVSLRISNAFVLDDGMAAVSARDLLVQAEIGYARALWPLLWGDLWAEASWTWGRVKTSLFDERFDTSVFLHSFTVGARYTVPALYWVIPHVRFGLGVGLGHFDVGPGMNTSSPSFEEASSTAVGVSGYLLAGVEVLVPTKRLRRGQSGITGGIVVEGGIAFGSSLSFDAAPDRDDDKLLISLGGTELGSLNPTGPVFRIGAVLRF